jgi:hypothetical protein
MNKGTHIDRKAQAIRKSVTNVSAMAVMTMIITAARSQIQIQTMMWLGCP